MNALLVDIGATKIRLASSNGRMFLKPVTLPTPTRWSDLSTSLHSAVYALMRGQKIDQVIGGVPGTLDKKHRILVRASNLPGWNNKPLYSFFANVTGAKHIEFHNDANLAGLGEAVYGAGKGSVVVAYLGIGSGVGGTRIVNKQLDVTTDGFRSGHQIIDASSSARCGCGERGDLESLISGRGLERQYNRPANKLTAAAYRTAASYLGLGCNNLTVMWSPDVIVLGGSVIKSLWPYRRLIERGLRYRLQAPPIVRATLGDYAGLYGALALLKKR